MRLRIAGVLLIALLFFPFSLFGSLSARDHLETFIELVSSKPLEEINQEAESLYKHYPPNLREKFTNFLLANAFYDANNGKAAKKYFQAVLQSFPEFSDYALFHLGEINRREKKFKEAINYYQAILKNHPNSIWTEKTEFQLANSYLGLRNFKDALKKFDYYLKQYPRSPDRELARYRKAICEEELGKKEEALKAYKAIWVDLPHAPFSTENEQRMERLLQTTSLKGFEPNSEERFQRAVRLFKDLHLSQSLMELLALEKQLGPEANQEFLDKLKHQLVRVYMRLRDFENAIALLQELKSRHRNPMIYGMIARCYLGMGEEKEAIDWYKQIIAIFPGSIEARSAQFNLGELYLRRADYEKAILYFKTFTATYRHDANWNDAYWMLGWAHYLKGESDHAIQIYDKILSTNPKGEDLVRVQYWRAKALLREKQGEEGRKILEDIILKNTLSYYSLVAAAQVQSMIPGRTLAAIIGEKESISDLLNKPVKEKRVPPEVLINNEHFQRAQTLLEIGIKEFASQELQVADSELTNSSPLIREYLAKAYQEAGNYYRPLLFATTTTASKLTLPISEENEETWKAAFPLAYWEEVKAYSAQFGVDPYIVLSLMRAESHFRPHVVSPAGAVGLMQLIPPTADRIALKLNHRNFLFKEMQRPIKNIQYGTYYVRHLIEQFEGTKVLAIPSYNAGPHRVKAWLKGRSGLPLDEFVEKIPYVETKNYIQRVLKNYWTYRLLYDRTIDAGIEMDIAYKIKGDVPPQEDWSLNFLGN